MTTITSYWTWPASGGLPVSQYVPPATFDRIIEMRPFSGCIRRDYVDANRRVIAQEWRRDESVRTLTGATTYDPPARGFHDWQD